MPAGRIILKSISESKKLAQLKSDGARLLYTWLLTHVDINGCFSGNALVVKGKVFTRLKHSPQTVESYLQDMENVGLIIRYEVNEDIFLYIPDFKDKQPSLQPNREAKPSIPPPTQEQLKSSSRVTQEKPNTSKVKESKVKDNITSTKEFFDYFNLKLKEKGWLKRNLELTYSRRRLIESRFKEGKTLDDLKLCVDNFIQDPWSERNKYIDLKYCIGVVRGIDKCEEWLNFSPQKSDESYLASALRYLEKGADLDRWLEVLRKVPEHLHSKIRIWADKKWQGKHSYFKAKEILAKENKKDA